MWWRRYAIGVIPTIACPANLSNLATSGQADILVVPQLLVRPGEVGSTELSWEVKVVMFGTVARYLVKPGHTQSFMSEMKSFEADPPAGWVYHTLFQSSKDPNEIWMSVVFEDEESYRKNAGSPDMDREYRKMLEQLQGEPEWHDGQVIHEAMRQSAKG
jgi:quinol monooxygenase YgiN